MMKTFRQILAENAKEYEYDLYSTSNLHAENIREQIRLALIAYRVCSVEPGIRKTPSQTNDVFPEYPNHSVYSAKIVTGLPIPIENNNGEQLISLRTSILCDHLKLVLAGVDPTKEPAKKTEAEYTPMASTEPTFKATVDAVAAGASAQDDVGIKRIGTFMKELQADRKERESATKTSDVYESFTVTHLALGAAAGRPLRKGYYLMETTSISDVYRVEGPFAACPGNVEYRDAALKGMQAEIMSSLSNGDRSVMEMKIPTLGDSAGVLENIAIKPVSRIFEVGVNDRRSGRSYHAVVRAVSENHARGIAVNQIAAKYNVEAKTLVAVNPQAQTGRVVDETV